MEDPVSIANGHPEPALVEDVVVQDPAPSKAAEVHRKKGIYIVRLPKREQQKEEEAIAKLQETLRHQVAKIKTVVQKRQAIRSQASEFRRQLNEARSLREDSSPEFEEKRKRMQELRDARKSYLDRITQIREAGTQLEARTEAELDDKIADCESRIASGGLPLREEKQLVNNIAKLKAQREKVQAYEVQYAAVAQLQAEANKVRDLIGSMKGEMDLLYGERSQVGDIMSDIRGKLDGCLRELEALDGDLSDLEDRKRGTADQLEAARAAHDASLQGWRENRKLSLTLRDMVEAGNVEEARALAAEQVEAALATLGDAAWRREYVALWAQQRKYAVSEVLPGSGPVNGAGQHAGNRAGPGNRGPGKPSAVPAQPQGAAKAKDIIAAIMQETRAVAAQHAAQQAAMRPAAVSDHSDEGVPEPEPAEAAAPPAKPEPQERAFIPGADETVTTAPRARPAKQANDTAAKLAELPNVDNAFAKFQPPTFVAGRGQQKLSEAERKELVREENRLKAAEAEQRKQRRLELAAKRRQQKKEQQLAAEQEAQRAAQQAQHQHQATQQPAEEAGEEQADGGNGSDSEVAAVARVDALAAGGTSPAQQAPHKRGVKGGKYKGVGGRGGSAPLARAPRKPAIKDNTAAKLLRLMDRHQTALVVGCVVFVTLVLALMAIRGSLG